MVMPGPSSSAPRGAVLRGRDAGAGPRLRLRDGDPSGTPPREEPLREEARAAGLAPGRRAPDAETGRLAVRGAPGRLLLMPRGYNLCLGSQTEKRGERGNAEAPA
ncbi:hypothetical protein GCM10009625_38070 [Brachybacterium fresconis]